jgi:hypothetical protein
MQAPGNFVLVLRLESCDGRRLEHLLFRSLSFLLPGYIRILYACLFEARIFRSQVLTPHDAEISRLVAEAFPEYSVISRIGPVESQAQRNIFVSPQVLAPSIHSIPSHQNSHIDYFTPLLSLLRSLICFTSPLSLSFAHCQLTILFISCYLEYSHSR